MGTFLKKLLLTTAIATSMNALATSKSAWVSFDFNLAQFNPVPSYGFQTCPPSEVMILRSNNNVPINLANIFLPAYPNYSGSMSLQGFNLPFATGCFVPGGEDTLLASSVSSSTVNFTAGGSALAFQANVSPESFSFDGTNSFQFQHCSILVPGNQIDCCYFYKDPNDPNTQPCTNLKKALAN